MPPLQAAKLLLVLIGFAAFGFFFGWHWLIMLCLPQLAKADRLIVVVGFLQYLGAILAFGGGGWWSREAGRYVSCPGGETMSLACLFLADTDAVAICRGMPV